MDLSLCTYFWVADLWDDPPLFYLVRDILVTYALCGFVLYWFRNLSALSLFFIWDISLLIMLSAGVAPVDVQQGILTDFVPIRAEIHREIATYRGTWADVQNARLIEALDIQFAGIPFLLFWRPYYSSHLRSLNACGVGPQCKVFIS